MSYGVIAPGNESQYAEISPSKIWKWWKVLWTIFKNVIYISLVVLAFDKVSTAFENLVFCLLVLIYQSVNWAHTALLRLTVEEAFATKRLFFMVLRHHGEATEEAESTINEVEKNYSNQIHLYYINLVGAIVVYLLVAWKVVATVFG